MPSHCCVPQCTFKGYRKASGEKVSFFNFPKSDGLRKKWIVAIRRDPGKHFKLKERTKVCSRHFRPSDFKTSLNGITKLTKDAVPSIFAWSNDNQSRKPPKDRHTTNVNKDGSDHDVSSSETFEPEQSEVLSNSQEDLCSLKAKVAELEDRLKRTENDLVEKNRLYQAVCDELKLSKHELLMKENKVKELKNKLEHSDSLLFTLNRFQSKENIAFYTGFPNFDTFMAIYKFLNTGEKGENLRYCSNKQDIPPEFYESLNNEDDEDDEEQESGSVAKKGRGRKLQPVDQFFMVMCRMRRGFKEQHLAHLFGLSQSSISRIFISWITYMFLKCGQVNIWPSKDIVLSTMPEAFKAYYSNTRIIIDCTEIRCEMPSSLLVNSELFSAYKNHQTLKGLIGIAPSGAITFISELYTGSISDREIVLRSGLLKQAFENGDMIMADKGFTIEDLLPLGVKVNYPPFLGNNAQMTPEEVITTQRIASVRIHVERAINKIKNFRIWQGDFPLSLIGVANQMWAVSAFLCNAQDPLISA